MQNGIVYGCNHGILHVKVVCFTRLSALFHAADGDEMFFNFSSDKGEEHFPSDTLLRLWTCDITFCIGRYDGSAYIH